MIHSFQSDSHTLTPPPSKHISVFKYGQNRSLAVYDIANMTSKYIVKYTVNKFLFCFSFLCIAQSRLDILLKWLLPFVPSE